VKEHWIYFLAGGLIVFLTFYIFRKRIEWLTRQSEDSAIRQDQVDVAFLLNSLKAKGELQDKLFNLLPIGVLLLNDQFEILSGNQLGFNFLNKLQPALDQRVLSCLGEVTLDELIKRSSDPLPIEICIDPDTSQVHEVQLRSAGTVEGQYWILMIADVTSEREIKNRIQVQDRLATLGQFSAGIAHDFNNVLSTILLYSDVILRDSTLSEQNKSRVQSIRGQSQRAAELVRSILDFSRSRPLQQTSFDFIPFLAATRELLNQVLPDHIDFKLEINSSLKSLPILGDPPRLEQMIMNIALNSRDAMPEGGKLIIRAETISGSRLDTSLLPGMDPGEWLRLQIQDTGSGIAPQDLSRIFEPFFTTKSSQGGSGLGLAQVYGIVKQHQGYIDLESTPGIGTLVTIYLPISSLDIFQNSRPETQLNLDGRGRLVLIVEDDQDLQRALGNLYEDQGFQVILAGNGEKALDVFNQVKEKICLIVTDVVMPVMGGLALYESVRDISPEPRFIFVSSHPAEIQGKIITPDPSVRILIKPYSRQEILLLSQQLLDQPDE